jgi:hypothetical protein
MKRRHPLTVRLGLSHPTGSHHHAQMSSIGFDELAIDGRIAL